MRYLKMALTLVTIALLGSARIVAQTPASDPSARLKQVLESFSRMIRADRAYVVLDEKPIRMHIWSRDGVTFPPGWPQQALAVSEQLGVAESDSLTLPDVAALPSGVETRSEASPGSRIQS